MNTPKDKALELFYKFNTITSKEFKSDTFTSATSTKQCALICVDEIISEYNVLQIETNFCYKQFLYWNEVKNEINKL